MRLRSLVVASLVVGVAALAVAVPASAFDCMVANKPTGAGSAATEISPGNFVGNKPNPGTEEQTHGGFVTELEGFDTFVHAPQGVLPPAREGGAQFNCDGKGLDVIHLC
jgi:hypothetical protein